MQPILSKKEMTEEDIKLQYITPAVISKWSSGKITMETPITDGQICLKGNLVFRKKPKKADYILYLCANHPIAVIEAKDNTHSISHGLQQAMDYAKMLDLPFAFSSNGDGFAEHDFLTGTEREFPLDEFPTEAELIARYKREVNGGMGLPQRKKPQSANPTTPASPPTRPDIISASPLTARWTPLPEGSSVCCWSWQRGPGRPTRHSRSFTVC